MDKRKVNREEKRKGRNKRILKRKNDRAVICTCLILVMFLFSGCIDQGADQTPESGVEITLVGNEGFLITAGDKKVLVDATFYGGPAYALPSEIQTSLEQALPPFDGIDLILITHLHQDHFHPLVTGTCLENNSEAILVSTEEVISQLEIAFPNFVKVKGRIKAVKPERGKKVEFTLNGIKLEALDMPHGGNYPGVNIGFLFTIGGMKILHTGDSLMTSSNLEVYDLSRENIDVTFLHYLYLTDASLHEAVPRIQAKHLVAMHLQVPWYDDDRDQIVNKIKTDFPDVIVFTEEMKKIRVLPEVFILSSSMAANEITSQVSFR